MTDIVNLERHGAVAVLTMQLVEKRNALTNDMTDALSAQMAAVQSDTRIRAVVLTGGRHFCSGGSLDNLKTKGLEMRAEMRQGRQ